MEVDRHTAAQSGEELNDAAPVVPRQAATVIVLRGGSDMLEVLLVKRNPEARFMGGAWVFPGGAVDAHEGEGDAAHRSAAVRELEEEAGIGAVAPGALVKFSRWITPAEVKVRFDTHFFLVPVPASAEPVPDGEECVEARWFAPAAALAAHERDEILLVFPTIKHLEQLGRFASADAALAETSGQEIRPVQPRILVSGDAVSVVLPGEPGYDDE